MLAGVFLTWTGMGYSIFHSYSKELLASMFNRSNPLFYFLVAYLFIAAIISVYWTHTRIMSEVKPPSFLVHTMTLMPCTDILSLSHYLP
jgi:hypothetical protein